MSAVVMHPAEALPLDSRRGTASMLLFIVTEAMLFVCLFFSILASASCRSRKYSDREKSFRTVARFRL